MKIDPEQYRWSALAAVMMTALIAFAFASYLIGAGLISLGFLILNWGRRDPYDDDEPA